MGSVLILIILVATTAVPVRAQVAFYAEVNKTFTPISILPGNLSRLEVSIFNPNSFQLDDAAWTDYLDSIQPGITLADPVNLDNTCGGAVTAVPGTATLALSGGTVPPQSGITPGSCTVAVDVTSTTPGNLINTIPAGELKATGGGFDITNSTPASATLRVATIQPPSLSKSFTNSTIYVGQSSRLQIRIINNDLFNALTEVGITDVIPANLTILASPAPYTTGCGAGASVTYENDPPNASLTLSGAVIAPNSSCYANVYVTSTYDGVYVNDIPSRSITTKQGVTNASAASAQLNVQAVAISKAFSPSTFQAGDTSTLTVTLRNVLDYALTNITLPDTLPGTVLTVVPGSGSTTCNDPDPLPPNATVTTTLPRTATLSGGYLPAGSPASPATCTFSVQVTAPAGASAGSWTNSIGARTMDNDQDITNVLAATAPIAIYAQGTGMPVGSSNSRKEFSPSSITTGGTSTLSIYLLAPVDTGLTNLSVFDEMPAGVTILASPPPSTTCTGGSVTYENVPPSSLTLTGGSLAANSTCYVRVTVSGLTAGTYPNSIAPGDIDNDQDRHPASPLTATLTITNPVVPSNLTQAKAFYPNIINVNSISTLTITLTNNNTVALTNLTLVDTLPGTTTNGIVIAPVPNASTDCGAPPAAVNIETSQRFRLVNGTIPARVGSVPGICHIYIDVQGKRSTTTAATYTNTVPITGVSAYNPDTGTTINADNAATNTITVATLTIGANKGFFPPSVSGGGVSKLSIDLINPNNYPLSGIAFNDMMPSGMIIANPPNLNTGTCGGTLVGAPLTNTFSFSGGSLNAASTCTLSLNATMTVNGNLTNIIEAGSITTLNGATNPQKAQASLTNLPGASLSKVFAPNPIVAGPANYSLLTITIQNTGGAEITGVGLLDTLPDGLVISGATTTVNNCGGSLVADVGTRPIQLTGGYLAASSSCTIIVPVTSLIPGSYMNQIDTGVLHTDQGATNNEPAVDTLVVTGTPELSIDKTVAEAEYDSTTDVLHYSYLVTNSGTLALDGPFTVTDDRFTVTCPPTPATLAPTESITCTAEYTVTQADIEAGSITNIASARGFYAGTPVDSPTDTVTINAVQNPELTLTKDGVLDMTVVDPDSQANPGDVINYTLNARNTGNIILTNVSISDPLLGTLSCTPAQPATLDPGAAMACTGSYTIDQDDINAGRVTNTATTDSDQTAPVQQEAQVNIPVQPVLELEKAGILDMTVVGPDTVTNEGDVIAYTLTATNSGNVPLTNVTISDTLLGSLTCTPAQPATLNSGESMVCTGIHTLTQGDIDFGEVQNTATADSDQTEPVDDELTVPAGQAPLIGAAKRVVSITNVSPGTYDVTFEILVRNYGNVTMPRVWVDDDLSLTFPVPTTFTVRSFTSPTLTVNPLYDGSTDTALLTGDDPLPVGGSGTITLVVRVVPASGGTFNNSAVAEGMLPNENRITDTSQDGMDPDPDEDGNPTNNNNPTPVNFGPNLFDPPFGIKTVNPGRLPILQWNLIWINDTNIVAINASSSDPIPTGTTFYDTGIPSGYPVPATALPGSINTGVSCTAAPGPTVTTACYYEVPSPAFPRGRIIWEGTLGPDFGATDPATAVNELTITFNVTVNDGVIQVINRATIDADLNGDSDLVDPGEPEVASISATWAAPMDDLPDKLPATGFTPGVVTPLGIQPGSLAYEETGGLRLEIPRLGVNIPIVGVPVNSEQTWDVTWLGNRAGWLNGTTFPTHAGNSAITGHVYGANGRTGPFAALSTLKYGDRVIVHGWRQQYIYEVRTVSRISPDNVKAVTRHEELPWLSLVTCRGYDADTGKYLQRVLVRAVQVEIR